MYLSSLLPLLPLFMSSPTSAITSVSLRANNPSEISGSEV
jgi:hypothetical protein